MPTISMFYGIIIRMYCAPSEHNPPRKKERLILAWMEIYQEELLADWELASNGELPFKIDLLK